MKLGENPSEEDHLGHWRVRANAFVIFVVAAAAGAAEPTWRAERSQVEILVPLRPGGAFNAKTSSLTGTLSLEPGTPARLAGELTMDLSTIDTGIALRNQHLRDNYLEIAKGAGFDKAVLSEIRLKDAGREDFVGRSPFTGTLLLHGIKHPVDGTAEIRAEGAGRRVQAEFRLVLTDWNVTPPEYLGVGVAATLLVKVQFSAVPAAK